MKIILLTIGLWLFVQLISAQQSFRLEWEIEDNLTPANAIVDNEGNTIVVGIIRKINQNNDGDAFIFKMTPDGEYSYFRYSSLTGINMIFKDVIQLDNGNYFAIGNYGLNIYNYPYDTIVVCIFDQELNKIIENRIELPPTYKIFGSAHLIKESTGSILVAGSAMLKDNPPINAVDLALIRFTQTGDTIESFYRHYQRNVTIYDIDKIPGSDNYLILEFITQLYGDFECYILKPDLTMDTVNYHNSFDYWVHDDIVTDYWYPDKTFIMSSGLTFDEQSSDYGLGVFRCDTLANILEYLFLNKTNIYDRHAYRQCMAYANENSIYIAGFMADYWDCNSPDSIELYVVDTALNQIAYKSLGGDISYDAVGVMTSEDKGAIIYGVAWHPSGENCYGNLVIYYVSREDLGLEPVQVFDTETNDNSSNVYPNPTSGIIHFYVNKELLTEQSRIKLYNSSGRKIYDYRLPDKGNTLQLNISNLERGWYVYEISNETQIISKGKFVKN
jgi:hypothetical protein